jgi:hypothetical protein
MAERRSPGACRVSRHVVVATVGNTITALKPASKSAACPSDVRALAVAAALEPRSTASTTWIPTRSLPDLEAYAETRGWIVVRVKR